MLDEELFLRAISVTLDNWPSFQMAISNGMGGPNAVEKINWLCSMIVQLFKDNAAGSVLTDDVLEYLDTVMDNEFDTVIDDGSAEMICQSIVAYYNRISSGDKEYVISKLEGLLSKRTQMMEQLRQASTSGQFEISPKSTTVTSNQTSASEMMDMEDDNRETVVDDGWTVVRRKK